MSGADHERPTTPAGNSRQNARAGFRGPDGNSSERVQEPADREEMRELIARYAQGVYRRRSTADLFTEDGVMTIRMAGYPLNQTRGMVNLEALFAGAIARPAMPAVHNAVIAVVGDEAVATSRVELHLSSESDPDGKVFAGCGTYDDRLRRVDGRWKFASREADVVIVGAVRKANPIGR
jgi:hypothetical protein